MPAAWYSPSSLSITLCVGVVLGMGLVHSQRPAPPLKPVSYAALVHREHAEQRLQRRQCETIRPRGFLPFGNPLPNPAFLDERGRDPSVKDIGVRETTCRAPDGFVYGESTGGWVPDKRAWLRAHGSARNVPVRPD